MSKASKILMLLVVTACCIFVSCLRNKGVNDVGTWNFSGIVVDGTTEGVLGSVVITYIDDDGIEQSVLSDVNGKFFIDDIPYGERTFVFSATPLNSYTSKRIVVSSYAEASSLDGVIGDVSRIVRLFPLTGEVSGKLAYKQWSTEYEIPAKFASFRIVYKDSSMENSEPSSFSAQADSLGMFKVTGLPVAPGSIISFDNLKINNTTYSLSSLTINLLNGKGVENIPDQIYTTTDSASLIRNILASNVLSKDGFGMLSVPVNDTIWYKLPMALQQGSVSVTMNGVSLPALNIKITDDTLFLIPHSQMEYDTFVEVKIQGLTLDGETFERLLDGASRFKTETCPYPIEANFWSQPWILKDRFGIGQTLWVRFSENLDTEKSAYSWAASSATMTLYGSGAFANAAFRISGDTLFVTPDQRLNLVYNSTSGFNIQCRTATGKTLKYYDFYANTIEDPLYLMWTNTRDTMGNTRNDMGLRDTIKVVSSVSGFSVVGVSVGDTGIAPPGLMLSDVKVIDNTIFYVPSLSLVSDTAYSMDFDLLFGNSTIRKDVLGVKWSTKKKVSIVSVDTKVNGSYRPLAVVGDSFKVTFSEPIDTGINAAVAFRVNITDVNNLKKRTSSFWDSECRTVTVKILDTLPSADFDAPAAYTSKATLTRAVESVTFDLVTKAGEQVFDCKPDGDPIALHTEKGMCVVNTNIILELDGRTSVEKDFVPITEFHSDDAIELEFSRVIDTARMDSLKFHVGIHKPGAVIVPAAVTIKSDLKTLVITPETLLETKTEYYIWIKNVLAEKIFGAAAISKHSGSFTGRSASSYLLDRPFKTQ